jgi:cell division protease FtsH
MRNLLRSNVFWLVAMGFMVLLYLVGPFRAENTEELQFKEFMAKVDEGLVKDVTFKGQRITGVFSDDSEFKTTGPNDTEHVANTLADKGIVPNYEEVGDDTLWITGLITLLPVVVMVIVVVWFVRNLQGNNGRAMSFGKSKARLQTEGARRFTFEDVAGIDECKEELEEIIDFLKDPRKFTRLGGRIPKGVLLMGAPGTGKTLLARAVAGEAGVPFFSISGSDFVEMFVGVGASRVRDLFEQGKKHAPCIIFIDEIDAVGRHRGAGLGGGHDEREQTLNQLLVEMDGFEATDHVIIVAATNRPDVLDPALLRPGRFDRRINVPTPDVRGRAEVLAIHTRPVPLGEDVDLDIVARGTPGFSGADLENLCNEAALIAARADKECVEMEDFIGAREKIVMGPERRSMVLPEWERKNTAYHEAGHAIIAHLLPGHDPVQKVTIVPRGRALGITWTLPTEDRLSLTRNAILKKLAMMMGGRAAEEVGMKSITGGAANDLKQATRLARHMICNLGMSDDLGPVSWGEGEQEVFLGRQMSQQQKAYSEQTARRIDDEVKRVLSMAYAAAKDILSTNAHVLERVAGVLIERESLDAEEFSALVEECQPIAPTSFAWLGA